jgi:hypothetical protein
MKHTKIPIRYLPFALSKKDKQKQIKMLNKSRKMYKKGKYYTRKRLPTYNNKVSNHIIDARKIYNIQNITPNKELSRRTGCSLSAVDFNILEKGCQHNKKAFILAKKSRKKYKYGHSKTKKVTV